MSSNYMPQLQQAFRMERHLLSPNQRAVMSTCVDPDNYQPRGVGNIFGRFDALQQGNRDGAKNGVPLVSERPCQNSADDTFAMKKVPRVLPHFHFAKWRQPNPAKPTGGQRSSSLSPKPTEPAAQLSYRPPTPLGGSSVAHRGILKAQRQNTYQSEGFDSPRGSFVGRSFWDSFDLNSRLNGDSNDSYASTASSNASNLADSLSRKTVRFAEGKPAMINGHSSMNTTHPPSAPSRSANAHTIARSINPCSPGIYEWEPDESRVPSSLSGGPNKPPKPPKLCVFHRPDRRLLTDSINLCDSNVQTYHNSQNPIQKSNGNMNVPSKLPKSPDISGEDSYANVEGIYVRGRRRLSDGPIPAKIDRVRLDAYMKPNLSSVPSDTSPNCPPPTNQIYRTEVRHDPSVGGTFIGQQKTLITITDATSVPAAPARLQPVSNSPPPTTTASPNNFSHKVKPKPSANNDDDESSQVTPTGDDSGRISSFPPPTASRVAPTKTPSPLIGINKSTMTPRLFNFREEQSNRSQPLRVDVSQLPIQKPMLIDDDPTPPLRGPPFTDGPRRRGKVAGDNQQLGVKTGSLDRDGVWRPNRLSVSGGRAPENKATANRLHNPNYPTFIDCVEDVLRTERRLQLPQTPSTLPTGGHQVPVFVAHSTTSAPINHRALSPNTTSAHRAANTTSSSARRLTSNP
uniref:SH2 domain-containing protein n=1 Tax=Mesocestoides corti TaxID=53468 RepID=A0A5K3ETJ3_MESCO